MATSYKMFVGILLWQCYNTITGWVQHEPHDKLKTLEGGGCMLEKIVSFFKSLFNKEKTTINLYIASNYVVIVVIK